MTRSDISCKTLIGPKPLSISFNKIGGSIIIYDGTRYLVLFGAEKYDSIFNRITYLKGIKSGITYIISHNYIRIKVGSYDSLPPEKSIDFS